MNRSPNKIFRIITLKDKLLYSCFKTEALNTFLRNNILNLRIQYFQYLTCQFLINFQIAMQPKKKNPLALQKYLVYNLPASNVIVLLC